MTSAKGLLISLVIITGILLGGLTLTSGGYTKYGVLDNNRTNITLNRTMNRLATINNTANVIENRTTGTGAFSIVETNWLGILFNSLGALVRDFSNINLIFFDLMADLEGNQVFVLPDWLTGLIMTILGLTIAFIVISYVTNRGLKQV